MTATLLEPATSKFNDLTPEERNALVVSVERLCRGLARRALGTVLGLDVDDLTQEALVAATEAAALWKPDREVRFSTYATTAITRHLGKLVTAHRCRAEVQTDDWVGFASPADGEEHAEGRDGHELTPQQEAAVARLPERSRAAVLLVIRDGLSPDQVGEQLGTSVKDVKLILRNAADQLRKDLALIARPALFDFCGAADQEAA
ncbi:MAG TPA: sigma-70 family RNA polymerase sigma factor [Urbifossiella sp.]|nr:sigma-70 family RNA polymerase sigma factor [Urbifossiella sp.]